MARLLLVLGVVLTACQPADEPVTVVTPPADALVLRMMATEHGPEASLSYRSERAVGRLHAGCWTREDLTDCTDGILTLPRRSIIAVPQGTTLIAVGDAEVVGVELFIPPKRSRPAESTGALDLRQGRARLDGALGTYILDAAGEWPQGGGSLSFGLEVVHPDPTEPEGRAGLVEELSKVGVDLARASRAEAAMVMVTPEAALRFARGEYGVRGTVNVYLGTLTERYRRTVRRLVYGVHFSGTAQPANHPKGSGFDDLVVFVDAHTGVEVTTVEF
jgi:hypothetical protein